ncbi:substrate-binding domain-containing protein [Anaerosporobacter faecicola]|uniref:substrate-binding domain-containing protein n=1 Tax=Anaerosporobacter faecicola TaxID=2718714 RepID=UPI00143B4FF1|nr:substrate-binding domain-containing protein [Anaerosporobacter faecicola]
MWDKGQSNKRLIIAGAFCILFMLVCTIGGILFFRMQMNRSTASLQQADRYRKYKNYYVLIPSDRKSSFWDTAYQAASEKANDADAYLELFGANLSEEYSQEQLMRMAIESDVDGIILEANESAEMTELINEAVNRQIPVITAMKDNPQSERQSFVGISSYNLGREYGKQICNIANQYITPVRVMVLFDANAKDTSQNMVYSSIQEIIEDEQDTNPIQIEVKALNSQGAFAAEEAIRDIFMGEEKLPDIIVCMNEINTSCVYQAVVDYNKVGSINIIGYDDSETILKAIERNVIVATVSVDAKQLGEYCMEALQEFQKMGHVSNYYAVDTTLIYTDNVQEYLGGESIEE